MMKLIMFAGLAILFNFGNVLVAVDCAGMEGHSSVQELSGERDDQHQSIVRTLNDAVALGRKNSESYDYESKTYKLSERVNEAISEAFEPFAYLDDVSVLRKRVRARTTDIDKLSASELRDDLELTQHDFTVLMIYERILNTAHDWGGMESAYAVRKAVGVEYVKLYKSMRIKAFELVELTDARNARQPNRGFLGRYTPGWLTPAKAVYELAKRLGFDVKGREAGVEKLGSAIDHFLAKSKAEEIYDDLQGAAIFRGQSARDVIAADQLRNVPRLNRGELIKLLGLRPDNRTFNVTGWTADGRGSAQINHGYYDAQSNGGYGLPPTVGTRWTLLPNGKGYVRSTGSSGNGSTKIDYFEIMRKDTYDALNNVSRESLKKWYFASMTFSSYFGINTDVLQRVRGRLGAKQDWGASDAAQKRSAKRFGELWTHLHQLMADQGLLIQPHLATASRVLIFKEGRSKEILTVIGEVSQGQSVEAMIRSASTRSDLRIVSIKILPNSGTFSEGFIAEVQLP